MLVPGEKLEQSACHSTANFYCKVEQIKQSEVAQKSVENSTDVPLNTLLLADQNTLIATATVEEFRCSQSENCK